MTLTAFVVTLLIGIIAGLRAMTAPPRQLGGIEDAVAIGGALLIVALLQ